MRAIVKALVVVLMIAALAGGLTYGQGGATGAINLTVEDSTGGWIAAADVQVIDARTEAVTRKVQTGADGTINIALLPPGRYRLVVNKAGFSEARASNIEVRVTETASVTIALKAGAVTEKVEITAEVLTVNTTSATTGASLGSSVVQELPLATQNYQQLLSLSAGASSELNASAQLGRGNVRVIVNGQREDNNNYLIEGISADDYNISQSTNIPLPNPDVIQEFKIQTALYDASQGRNGGGNVNAIFKSGGKGFHGDVYEYFRNDVFNANEFFLNRAGQSRPSVKQNIFGASAGGPLGTEKFGYIFVNYQGSRQRSALSPGTSINNPAFPIIPGGVRDATMLANAFSSPATAPTVLNPAGCAANVITVDPVILNLMLTKNDQFGGDPNGYMLPSLPGIAGVTVDPDTCAATVNSAPLTISKPGKYTDDQFTTSWDREFRGGSDKISARFFLSNSESYLPFGAGGLQASFGGTLASSISSTDLNFPYDLPVYSRFFSVSETHLFSPTLVNDFRFGLVRINNPMINVPPLGATATDLGIDRPTNNVTTSMYKFTLASSGMQIGPTPPSDQSQAQNDFHFVDNLSWVRGAHSFRFGGEVTHVRLDKLFPQVFNGQLFIVNDTAGGLTDWQKFMSGQVDFSFGGGGVYDHQYRTNDYGFFAQDDWKVTRDLTLNLGLRFELMGAFKDNLCHLGNMDPNLANAGQNPYVYPPCVTALNIPGLTASGKNNTAYDNAYAKDYGPRFGVAWDVFGKHKTTVRGGYGIYYTKEDTAAIDQLTFNPPFLPVAFGPGQAGCLGSFFSATPLVGCPSPNINALPPGGVIDANFVPCYALLQGFVGNDTNQSPNYACNGPGIPTTNVFALTLPRKFVSPNTQQWNLGIQRSIGKDWVIEVGYTGTHAVHLRETRTSLQARRASVANPVVLTDVNNVQWTITTNTFGNAPARSRALGINGWGGFQLFANDAFSHYHSLQTTVSRRWSAGYFQAAYTWSKSTDATSSGNTALNTAFNDESTMDASRGLSDFDRTHRLSVTYRYDLPFFSKADGWQHALLANWAVSGVTILQSGSPFSIIDSGAGTAFLVPGLAALTLGAQLAPGGSIAAGTTSGDIHQRLDGYLNAANFTTAPLMDAAACALDGNFCTTDFGNLGRNIYRGPRQQNWDFSLIKNIKLNERNSMRFTADFFNVWNHANFGNPSVTDVENPGGFGKIFSTVGTPRLIQFSLRWAF
ncbi:MAG: TonB-dependent receptor [Acidobacteriia bacterium]|nr:TonB-dependent receptor [Terriglobia bacterium]